MATESICILMAVYNGELYLKEQIDSIVSQTYENLKILISDDGSQDATKSILMAYKKEYPARIDIIDGPRNGLECNFYNLIAKAQGFDLYAFADQDDIWDQDKLTRAVQCYRDFKNDKPFVYCSSSILVDKDLKFIRHEVGHSAGLIELRQALGHNIATGNTIVFNEATRILFPLELQNIDPLGHDWLTFIYALMFGGKVVYDDFPGVLYRIHASNNSGIKFNHIGRLKLLWDWVFKGKLRRTNSQIIESIRLVFNEISPESKDLIEKFKVMHDGKLFNRLNAYWKSGIVRRSRRTNWVNLIAVIFGRF